MKLHHLKYKKNYRAFILDIIDQDAKEDEIKLIDDKAKIRFLFDRFYSERSYDIKRKGKRQAMIDWLSGLALSLPCYNGEVIDLAIEMGSIDDNPSDQLIDRVLANYFPFMASIVLDMEKEINVFADPLNQPAFLFERA
tara:strand:+ start:274 stop:690 length:417 start_codon:yes stop_codon:yes gene_type:complete